MNGKKSKAVEEILLRITVLDPPVGVTFAVQSGRVDLIPPTEQTPGKVVFEFPVRLRPNSAAEPDYAGPAVQGRRGERFVYVNSGTLAGQENSCWTRRAKIPLSGLAAAAKQQSGAVVCTEIRGRADDGGPVCAWVHLPHGWRVRLPN